MLRRRGWLFDVDGVDVSIGSSGWYTAWAYVFRRKVPSLS